MLQIMLADLLRRFLTRWRTLSKRARLVAVGATVALVFGLAGASWHGSRNDQANVGDKSRHTKRFYPTEAQWTALTVEPVQNSVFRSELVTEGKIAVDEDHATPIFSPYAGRVTRLLAKPGDTVEQGQPLFVVEATDMVQALNEYTAARAAMNKATSQLDVAKIVEKRHRELFESKAVAQRELEQAQIALVTAQKDKRAAESGLEAARRRGPAQGWAGTIRGQ
jgi:membrane fusion protein, heavy metal efflux system